MKSSLIDKLGMFLLKDGFTVKSLTRTCFDLLARKQEKILLIKVLEDAIQTELIRVRLREIKRLQTTLATPSHLIFVNM